MKRLTKTEARKIIADWYSSVEDNDDKSHSGTNFKIHPVSGNASNLSVRNEIIDININEYFDLYIRCKDEHKALMERLISSDVSLNSINSLLEKNTISGNVLNASKLILDLSRIAFDNLYRARDVLITESEKSKIINDAKSKYEDYLAALRAIDFYVESNQENLQSRFYNSNTAHVIEHWESKKKTVSRTSNPNARRLDMFSKYAIYFNENYGTPHWNDVVSITSAFYDCDDTSPENIRIALSKKLGLTKKKP